MAMKKFINDPSNLTAELLDGLVQCYPDKLALAKDKIVVRANPKPADKVAIVTLGGTGKQPEFGENLATEEIRRRSGNFWAGLQHGDRSAMLPVNADHALWISSSMTASVLTPGSSPAIAAPFAMLRTLPFGYGLIRERAGEWRQRLACLLPRCCGASSWSAATANLFAR